MRFWSSVAHHFAIAASSAKGEFGKEPMGVPAVATRSAFCPLEMKVFAPLTT